MRDEHGPDRRLRPADAGTSITRPPRMELVFTSARSTTSFMSIRCWRSRSKLRRVQDRDAAATLSDDAAPPAWEHEERRRSAATAEAR
jgi:hypothetical protein